ncbi:MAG TPA: hypothetical protein VMT37_11335 [Solirubrobacterales bacterium]|nr:hypothetical protein [Solirubrobacterales bacterium]
MRRGKLKLPGALLVASAIALLLAAGAAAITIGGSYGPFSVKATFDVTPHELPAKGEAPVTMTSILRVKQKGGTPASLKTVTFQVDKHGSIGRRGVPVCTAAKLAETTPSQARKRCAGSLVGTGEGKANVTLPGQSTVQISSPLSLFNGPLDHGRPTLLAHAYETLPKPQALVVPIVIERVKHGRYGYRAKVQLPPIAEGYGSATLAEVKIGRVFDRHGQRIGYFNASCSGGRLQAHGVLSFSDGTLAPTTLVTPCNVSG